MNPCATCRHCDKKPDAANHLKWLCTFTHLNPVTGLPWDGHAEGEPCYLARMDHNSNCCGFRGQHYAADAKEVRRSFERNDRAEPNESTGTTKHTFRERPPQ